VTLRVQKISQWRSNPWGLTNFIADLDAILGKYATPLLRRGESHY